MQQRFNTAAYTPAPPAGRHSYLLPHPELYNLAVDPDESYDLAAQNPQILDRIQDSLQNGRCLCGLGDSAGWVIMSTMRYFREEYEEHCLRNECSAERLEVAARA